VGAGGRVPARPPACRALSPCSLVAFFSAHRGALVPGQRPTARPGPGWCGLFPALGAGLALGLFTRPFFFPGRRRGSLSCWWLSGVAGPLGPPPFGAPAVFRAGLLPLPAAAPWPRRLRPGPGLPARLPWTRGRRRCRWPGRLLSPPRPSDLCPSAPAAAGSAAARRLATVPAPRPLPLLGRPGLGRVSRLAGRARRWAVLRPSPAWGRVPVSPLVPRGLPASPPCSPLLALSRRTRAAPIAFCYLPGVVSPVPGSPWRPRASFLGRPGAALGARRLPSRRPRRRRRWPRHRSPGRAPRPAARRFGAAPGAGGGVVVSTVPPAPRAAVRHAWRASAVPGWCSRGPGCCFRRWSPLCPVQ